MGNVFDCETSDALDPDNFPKDDPDQRLVIDSGTRFGACRLWDIQRRFYNVVGPRAWSKAIVPHLLSSNAYVARAYAKVLIAFLRDLYQAASSGAVNPAEPVYIIEFGTGHGKLGFLLMELVKDFADAIPTCATPSGYPFVVVLTDVSAANVDDIASREALAAYAEIGVLDFAVLDATAPADTPITLRSSGKVLAPGQVANPVVALVNYVFDTLPQDVLRLDAGTPHLGKLAISIRHSDLYADDVPADDDDVDEAAQADKQPASPAEASERVPGLAAASDWSETASLARKLLLEWQWEATSPGELDAMLSEAHPALAQTVRQTYLEDARFQDARAVLLPVGGARLLQRVQQLSGGRYLMLAMDKGHVDARTILEADATPHVAEHGALSFMANFHCLAALHKASAAAPPKLVTQSKSIGDQEPLQDQGDGDDKKQLEHTGSKPLAPSAAQSSAVASSSSSSAAAAASASSASSSSSSSAAATDVMEAWPAPVCMRTEQSDGLVKVVLLAGGLHRRVLRGAAQEFRTGIVQGSPDDFASLHRGVKAEVPKERISLAMATSILRLAACDPDVFFKFRDPLIQRCVPTEASTAAQDDLSADSDLVMARHFHMHAEKDVYFEVGRVCMSLRQYHKAFEAFQASQAACGRHHVTLHNMGVCAYFLKDFASAQVLLEESMEGRPDYPSARAWLARVRDALTTGGMTPQEADDDMARQQAAQQRAEAMAAMRARAELEQEVSRHGIHVGEDDDDGFDDDDEDDLMDGEGFDDGAENYDDDDEEGGDEDDEDDDEEFEDGQDVYGPEQDGYRFGGGDEYDDGQVGMDESVAMDDDVM